MTLTCTRAVIGARIEGIDADAAAQWLLSGDEACAPPGFANCWALVELPDALVWGCRSDGLWTWSLTAGASLAGREGDILEARIFNQQSEILLWRSEGRLTGRRLSESAETFEPWLEPIERRHLFATTKVGELKGAFRRYEDAVGRALDAPDGKGVVVRSYLTQDSETGSARVAATRFVEVYQ